jgi:oligoribonuclease NrnB/cAMP/cGMP phosphodiesterase (DHH superfamily)
MAKCFYHSADFDGIASAAIVNYFKPGIELHPINYGQEFPWDTLIADELVYMVDFSLQPFSDMIRLNNTVNLVWIDHHITAINERVKSDALLNKQFKGLQLSSTAACELVWRWFSRKDAPLPIHYIGRWDIWDHYIPEIELFQLGLKVLNPDPTHLFWKTVFDYALADQASINLSYSVDWVTELIANGQILLEYETQRSKRICASYGQETFFAGYRCVALNGPTGGSKMFEAVYNKDDYDIFISYCRLPSQKWTVSLYSTGKVDVGTLAKAHGGGGHAGAAGFQTNELPFEY